MVDAERLRRILQRVSDDLSRLRAYRARDPVALLDNSESLGNIKYLFVTALEGCIDAAQHVCSSEGWGPPETNAAAMTVLATHGVVDAGLGETMQAAVRFRNLLVHGYTNVDDKLVVGYLERLSELEAYVSAIGQLIEHD